MKIKRPEMFTQAESSRVNNIFFADIVFYSRIYRNNDCRGNSAVSYDDSETYGIYNER